MRALGRGVRRLADLSVERRDARRVDDDAALAVLVGLGRRDRLGGDGEDGERADEVDLDDLAVERRGRGRPCVPRMRADGPMPAQLTTVRSGRAGSFAATCSTAARTSLLGGDVGGDVLDALDGGRGLAARRGGRGRRPGLPRRRGRPRWRRRGPEAPPVTMAAVFAICMAAILPCGGASSVGAGSYGGGMALRIGGHVDQADPVAEAAARGAHAEPVLPRRPPELQGTGRAVRGRRGGPQGGRRGGRGRPLRPRALPDQRRLDEQPDPHPRPQAAPAAPHRGGRDRREGRHRPRRAPRQGRGRRRSASTTGASASTASTCACPCSSRTPPAATTRWRGGSRRSSGSGRPSGGPRAATPSGSASTPATPTPAATTSAASSRRSGRSPAASTSSTATTAATSSTPAPTATPTSARATSTAPTSPTSSATPAPPSSSRPRRRRGPGRRHHLAARAPGRVRPARTGSAGGEAVTGR